MCNKQKKKTISILTNQICLARATIFEIKQHRATQEKPNNNRLLLIPKGVQKLMILRSQKIHQTVNATLQQAGDKVQRRMIQKEWTKLYDEVVPLKP